MEIRFSNNMEEAKKHIGKIYIESGEKGASMNGNVAQILKAFFNICEAMAVIKIPEKLMISIIQDTRKLQRECPVCHNEEIGAYDNFCKICGYKFNKKREEHNNGCCK